MEANPPQTPAHSSMADHIGFYRPAWVFASPHLVKANPPPADYVAQPSQEFAVGYVQRQQYYNSQYHLYNPYLMRHAQVFRYNQERQPRHLDGTQSNAGDAPSTSHDDPVDISCGSEVAKQMPPDHGKISGDNLDVPCAVCGDIASGVHYRVYTCEGCKGFFRRTHLRDKQLVCERANSCLINKQTRKSCKACRYQRCLHAGMVIEEIFLKRQAMKSKLKDKRKSQPWSDLTKTLSAAYHESFIVAYKTHSMLKDCLQTANKELRVVGRAQAQQFALKVPVISTLSQATQQVVLGHAVPELMILHLASRFVPEQKGFSFSDGRFLPLAVVVEILGRPLTLKIIRFAVFMIYVGVDETELSLLCGLMVTLPDCVSASSTDIEALEKQFKAHLNALVRYKKRKRCFNPLTFGKMILRLIDVLVTGFHDCGQSIESYMQEAVFNSHTSNSLSYQAAADAECSVHSHNQEERILPTYSLRVVEGD